MAAKNDENMLNFKIKKLYKVHFKKDCYFFVE